ncbi:thioredoxin-dependent thiol peroxidase [Shewanella sp. N2AIL]|uniref:thioredoxin-dependent thiol peroxidase n=1 Tax=Shewanella TaxID=22 RepID=UPI0001883E63|nr:MULTISPECIES: thioredoxin-dependent thiol peroxidase [Shewanella]ACK46295.1 alkyl hydroperoxide reductase/ Thiol specific antioxidant/ Mal allergen [Shewanella baltica OS223]MCI2963106.1 thioredoxin-dependent thiol peroxidase [Shewanella sp. N2AIL]MCS6099108.1 thioredoxin-dependent thiol peroxidase [Shewanella baltica]MCS6133953.1 thioredoxin-dependent thiol peroxidase [Shewanella baltica]MCS6181936.1 thioredoxin-dependent thiol peroxidase [Shewanella baltica]
MNTLTAGAKAPQFTLHDQHGTSVSLADSLKQGPVLVYFYPKAATPGCTVQACGLRDSKAALDSHNVTVFGISPDPVAKLAKFAEKQALNFTLLSDEDHSVADAFGVWGEKKFMGKTYDGIHRLSFLINTDGTIAHVFDKFKTKDHHEVVLAQIAG